MWQRTLCIMSLLRFHPVIAWGRGRERCQPAQVSTFQPVTPRPGQLSRMHRLPDLQGVSVGLGQCCTSAQIGVNVRKLVFSKCLPSGPATPSGGVSFSGAPHCPGAPPRPIWPFPAGSTQLSSLLAVRRSCCWPLLCYMFGRAALGGSAVQACKAGGGGGWPGHSRRPPQPAPAPPGS